jgi:hypothetical protein
MEIVYATTTSMVVTPGGGQVRVDKGTHWPATDPVVVAHPSLFSADARYGLNFSTEPEGYGAPVEQATAAPGERRNVRRG